MIASTGLDMAYAPSPAALKAALNSINGHWALVYIGGPRNGGHGWSPAYVAQAAAVGVKEFLPCYVGLQNVPNLGLYDSLSFDAGVANGQDAARLMTLFGWGHGCPCALDVEYDTASRVTAQALAYCDGWCKAVREAGFNPGVYGPLFFLSLLNGLANKPGFVFAAYWVSSAVNSGLNPAAIGSLPNGMFQDARVWQYAGDTTVDGLGADIDVTDMRLAPPPGTPYDAPPVKPVKPPVKYPAEVYAAGAWIAALDAMAHSVPVAKYVATQQKIRGWLKTHP